MSSQAANQLEIYPAPPLVITALRGDLKATFGTDLVCAAVQQGKTMN